MAGCKNDKIKVKKGKNTRSMQPSEMRRLRKEMRFRLTELAQDLGIPYRTLQDYEGGQRGIPESFAERLREAHAADRRFFAEMDQRMDAEDKKEKAQIKT